MNMLPLIISLVEDLLEQHYQRPQFFGMKTNSEHTPSNGCCHRPHCTRQSQCTKNSNTLTSTKDTFQVCMDVKDFAPNEISVKTVDNSIVVEGKHEERQDEHGYISRQFTRRYVLPDGYEAKDVVSQLSSDGLLTLKAPPVAKTPKGGNVRVVQIQQTGPADRTVDKQSTEKAAKVDTTES